MKQYLLCLMLVALIAVPAEAVKPPLAGKAVRIGDFSVVPLLDGPTSFPLALFKGADEEVMLKTAGARTLPGAYNVFLIRRGKERFLVDAGNGALRPGNAGQLPRRLKQAGTAPEDISKIFVTHMHGDHIGGLVRDGMPAFPAAKVYVPKNEYDYWMDEEAMRLAPENGRGMFALVRDVMRVLERNGLLVLFRPGEAVSPGIASEPLFGHTPGHTGFMLTSGDEKLFFIGDLLHGAALQMPRPDITVNFDVDQNMARETRLRAFKQLAGERIPVAGAHLPFPGIGLVRPAGDGYTLAPLK